MPRRRSVLAARFTCGAVACASAACGAPIAAPPVAAPPAASPPSAQLAVAHEGVVRILDITPTGVHTSRTVFTPGTSIDTLVWGAGDPAVLLDGPRPWFPPDAPDGPPPPSPHAFEIGQITVRGYVPFAALPAVTWDIAHDGASAIAPQWALLVDADGAVWQEHCAWGFSADGGEHCASDGERYARRSPKPLVVTAEVPKPPPALAPPAVAPPARPQVTLSSRRVGESAYDVLVCGDRATTEYPARGDDDPSFAGVSAPTWLASEPPMFAVERASAGFELTSRVVIFEGCAPSTRYTGYATGPGGLVAVYGPGGVTVLWRGSAIGTTEGATRVAFAPRP